MARTPLFRALRKLAREHHDAFVLKREVHELRDKRAEAKLRHDVRGDGHARGITRRQFVAGSAAVGVAAAVGTRALAQSQPTVAIVGGGIAGLSAALTLLDSGYRATIFEALPNRVGGRMLSDRASGPACGTCHTVGSPPSFGWADNQVTDVFGEMIDTGHSTMRSLAQRFGLPLVDSLAAEPSGSTDTYHFLGYRYTKAQADADFAAFYPTLRADLQAAGYPTTYDRSTAAGRALDNMSIYNWIESRVPGGHGSLLGALLDVAYNIEYGADTTDQSALNLIYMLGYSNRRVLQVFGPSDERYRIAGGIDTLPAAIANAIGPSYIRKDWVLESIVRNSDGRFTLTFDNHGSQTVVADYVILALPFASLRNVSFGSAGFDGLKTQAIQELGAGKNGKLQLQFTQRYWNQTGAWGKGNGTFFADTGCQAGWEPTRGYAGASGILVKYTGGSVAAAQQLRHPYGHSVNSSAVRADAAQFLTQLEPLYPGISSRYNGLAAASMAHLNRFWNSSYCYWRVGQAQRFGGYEGVRQNNVFFAGEHTSLDYQGFMEGGAITGVTVGTELARILRRR